MKKRKIRYDRLFLIFSIAISTVSIASRAIARDKTLENDYVPTESFRLIGEGLPFNDLQDQEIIEIYTNDNAVDHLDNLIYLGQFRLTAYCDCVKCQEQWVGTTAMGVAPTVNHTIAVDPSIIPLGSIVYIDGMRYVAEDVGGAIKGNHIDVFVGSHEETYSNEYNRYADVYIER